MSREIKFRAWDGERLRLVWGLGWIDGELDTVNTPKYHGPVVENVVIMQYTGTNDSKDNNIYEGDIVKYRQRNLDQAFGIEEGPDYIERIIEIKYRGQSFNVPGGFIKDLEVIGNLYENPNLLEDSK